MTTLREAAQDSLRALLLIQPQVRGAIPRQDVEDAIDALRAALAEPQVWVCPEAADTHRYAAPGHCEDCGKTLVQVEEPVQEPVPTLVAWSYELSNLMCEHGYDGWTHRITRYKPNAPEGSIRNLTPLYTAPIQRKPLTCDQIRELADQVLPNEKTFHQGDPKDWGYLFSGHELEEFARRIERAQGITE